MSDQTSLLRILDAAANRAGEGLRVVEDYLRFALDDRHFTSLAKQLRHDLAAALATIPPAERHAARDTIADVGTEIGTPSEAQRTIWQPSRRPASSDSNRPCEASKNTPNCSIRNPLRRSSRFATGLTLSNGPPASRPIACGG